MIPVITWELRRRRMFTFWWTVGISSLIAMTVLAYKAIGHDAKQLNSAFDSLTTSAGGFFGGSDFFSPIGYLSSQIYYILLPILVIIMVTTLASSLMNRDENDNTVEYTLARAITRNQLLLAKTIAALIITVVICGLTYLVTLLCVHVADISISQPHLLVTHLLAFAFSASFGVIAFALMAVSQFTRKFAVAVAIVLALGGYVVSSLAGLVHNLKDIAKLMPYHYYDTVGLLGGHIERGLIVYLVGTLIVAVILATVGYSRRDIG